MAKLLETDLLSNQDISSALEIGSYTAAAEKFLGIDVFADQVAGNDDYVIYVTRQLAGAGSVYKSPVTTEAVASGVTEIWFPSIVVRVSNNDVIKVYLTGASTDTTTPDTRVEFWDAPVVVADILSDATAFAGANIDQQLTTLLTTAMTESYAADGAAATLAQALYEIMQFHNERNFGAFDDDGEATLTIKKWDGSTAGPTYTITGDGITRAS